MANQLTSMDGLRYLEAEHVEHPSGTMAGLTLCSCDDEKLGTLEGVVLEPSSRRIRYFVVQRRASLMTRFYLLAADTQAVLDVRDRTLRVQARAEDLTRFDSRSVPHFSDEDAMTAMFSRPAA